MKRFNWQIWFGLGLIGLSAGLYWIHYLIFHESHHIFIFLVEDIAFVPIEVLLVSLIIHRLLSLREKRAMMKKLNMVIGTFFNDTGTQMLHMLSDFDIQLNEIQECLIPDSGWKEKDFVNAMNKARNHDALIRVNPAKLGMMKSFLAGRRDFLLRLLENPNLLEHESFTDLLWAVFHLADELSRREKINDLPEKDLKHLTGDINRVYASLITIWLNYMLHLKQDYPYLYSLALRSNPFDADAAVMIR